MILKKSYFALLLLLLSCGNNEEWYENMIINDVTTADFEDPNFYSYMQGYYDKNDDKIFQKNEIIAVKSLLINSTVGFSDLKGLEKFVALEKLEIVLFGQYKKKLKISNPRIRNLNFEKTWLPALDITELTELQVFNCGGVKKSLDLSNNKKLKHFTGRNIDTLDLTNNTEIEKIECQGNRIDSINLSKCVKLQHLNLDEAQFSSLDIRNCINLKYLNINSRYIDTDAPIDISKNKNLEEIVVNGRDRMLDITQNPKLKKIHIESYDNNLFIIYISKNQTKPKVETSFGDVPYEFQYK